MSFVVVSTLHRLIRSFIENPPSNFYFKLFFFFRFSQSIKRMGAFRISFIWYFIFAKCSAPLSYALCINNFYCSKPFVVIIFFIIFNQVYIYFVIIILFFKNFIIFCDFFFFEQLKECYKSPTNYFYVLPLYELSDPTSNRLAKNRSKRCLYCSE